MANAYKVIDEKTWERAMHCMVFRNSVEPAFCVTFDVDITNFLQHVRKQNFSYASVSSGTPFFCRWHTYWTICG